MKALQSAAEEDFVRRLCAHLRENYSQAVVRLPEEELPVEELPEDDFRALVRRSIERARSYGMTFESSISAFTAIRFEVAPNFDRHSISKLCLKDEDIEPNERLNEILRLLSEDHWEKFRNEYDPQDWEEDDEEEEREETEKPVGGKAQDLAETMINPEAVKKPEAAQKPEATEQPDFSETVMNPENAGEQDFAQTVMNPDVAEKKGKSGDDDDFDQFETILNIDIDEE